MITAFGSAFGHGRALEAYLAVACFINGTLLLVVPQASLDSIIVSDLAWYGYDIYVALTFYFKAFFSGVGVILNIRGYSSSKYFRVIGALAGSFMWSAYTIKLIILSAYTVPSLGFLICAFFASIRIIALALAGLPRPGAPGAI